jgi:hypothetical protein
MELARITGRMKVNPARFERRANPRTGQLGKASVWMSDAQRKAWAMFQHEIPWLCESDRALVEVAATIRARLMAGEAVPTASLNLLRLCCAQMGGSPSDRSRVNVVEQPNEDPIADAYLRRQ